MYTGGFERLPVTSPEPNTAKSLDATNCARGYYLLMNKFTYTYFFCRRLSTLQVSTFYKQRLPVITDLFRIQFDTSLILNVFNQQGVVRVRKRVTLIAITVSVIFGVCWLTQSVSYVLMFHIRAHVFGNVIYVASTTMIMVNSAINPFVYALLSQRFRKKVKAMLSCTVICAGRSQLQNAYGQENAKRE